LYALRGQRAQLMETLRESKRHALTLLASRLEQSLLQTTQAPFLAVGELPFTDISSEEHLHRVCVSFPAVEQIIFFNDQKDLIQSFPVPANRRQRRLNRWIVQRVQEERTDENEQPFFLHTIVETVRGKPALFAYRPLIARASDKAGAQFASEGWILIHFNMDILNTNPIAPLLAEFSEKQGGAARLQDPEFTVRKDSLISPLTRVLPGWMLVLDPPTASQDSWLPSQGWVTISVATGALLALTITGFAVWWQIRREHALVKLRNRFVANVSHELKTPLSLIRMYAETLYLKRLRNPKKQEEYYRVILREAERLSTMISNVLDFTRLRAGTKVYELTETDLHATVSSVLEHYLGQYEQSGIRFDVVLGDQLPPVAHDPDGVTQILLNLLDNAIKYAANGCLVEVHLVRDFDWVELQVIDFGPGIPEQQHAQLSQDYKQGHIAKMASGSGLGLTLVEQICKAHHAHFILDTPETPGGVKAVVSFPSYKK
ncbi:MAG: sensor histidine kinase, partial [Gammaproteobacteria bacterium]